MSNKKIKKEDVDFRRISVYADDVIFSERLKEDFLKSSYTCKSKYATNLLEYALDQKQKPKDLEKTLDIVSEIFKELKVVSNKIKDINDSASIDECVSKFINLLNNWCDRLNKNYQANNRGINQILTNQEELSKMLAFIINFNLEVNNKSFLKGNVLKLEDINNGKYDVLPERFTISKDVNYSGLRD